MPTDSWCPILVSIPVTVTELRSSPSRWKSWNAWASLAWSSKISHLADTGRIWRWANGIFQWRETRKPMGIHGILPSNSCWFHGILGKSLRFPQKKVILVPQFGTVHHGLKDSKGRPEVGCFCPPNWVRCHRGHHQSNCGIKMSQWWER